MKLDADIMEEYQYHQGSWEMELPDAVGYLGVSQMEGGRWLPRTPGSCGGSVAEPVGGAQDCTTAPQTDWRSWGVRQIIGFGSKPPYPVRNRHEKLPAAEKRDEMGDPYQHQQSVMEARPGRSRHSGVIQVRRSHWAVQGRNQPDHPGLGWRRRGGVIAGPSSQDRSSPNWLD